MAVRDSFAKLLQWTTQVSTRSGQKAPLSGSGDVTSGVRAAALSLELPPRFRLRDKLGQGGMGIVYRVYDSELGHDVALKSLSRLEPTELYYLKNEFRGLAGVRHPNLIELYELHSGERSCFFTMEIVPGSDLLEYVRTREADGQRHCDWERLRDCARQLALGLNAVHAAGKLHRDVKPSNVMVTTAGRVVLLDFGLVAPIPPSDGRISGDDFFVGTIDYMAPEQAQSEPLTAAADWYSFGATLYEAAAGRRPIERAFEWLIRARHDDEPPRITPYAPDVPEDIEALVCALLSPAKTARPTGAQVLERLLVSTPVTHSFPASYALSRTGQVTFQNRHDELARMLGALAALRAQQPSIFHLHGPSGIGKTELARHFVEHAARAGAMVLRGRCHPQESLAFNALDGMVDSLSQVLDRMPSEEVESLLPPDADALPKLFPVLGRNELLAGARTDELGLETVSRGARALKALLAALGRRGPLVIWLDDVQWGDDDSGKLLRELVRPPNVPNLMLLLSYRSEDRPNSRTLNALASAADTGEIALEVHDLPLGPLSESDALALVEMAFGKPNASQFELGRFAREAEGFPFFAHEIGRYLADHSHDDSPLASSLRLHDMLARRLEGLSEVARRVLEIVSIAGGPLEPRLILRAAGLDDAARPVLLNLEDLNLVRSATLGPGRRTEIYHHRIRDVVISLLDEAARRAYHRDVAEAMLTASSPSLPQVVDHYHSAGEVDSLRRYVASAARQAADAFAFDRAASLYRRAIEFGSCEFGPIELHERLGDALANAGHGRDAGQSFERAAALGDPLTAPPDYLLSLRKRAADQYLKSWQRTDAARALETVLDPLGIRMPKSRAAALRETLANRALIAAERWVLDPEPRTASPAMADRLEVLMTLMKVYSMIDHVYGIVFGTRLLLDALRQGDRKFIMLGLACECASWSALRGGLARRQSESHLAELERLGRDHGDAYIRASIRACTGEMLHFRGEFASAAVNLEAGLAGYRDLRRGLTVDLAVQSSFYLGALGFLGRLREQGQLLDNELLLAEARGDNYFLATCAAGHSSLAWVVCGRREDAAKWAARVLAIAPTGFSSQHYFHLTATVMLDLHRGDGLQAFAQMEAAWPAVRSNHYLSLALIGDDLRYLRARAALAAATQAGATRLRSRNLRIALEEARLIEAHELPCAPAWAGLLRAGAAAVQGRTSEATAALRHAIPTLRRCEMLFSAAAASYVLARLDASENAAGAAAERWMLDAGVVDLDAAARLLVPGCVG